MTTIRSSQVPHDSLCGYLVRFLGVFAKTSALMAIPRVLSGCNPDRAWTRICPPLMSCNESSDGQCPQAQASEETTVPSTSNRLRKRPLGKTDVFVDDFIQLGQGGQARMNALRNHLLHDINQILAQPLLDNRP